MRRQLTLVIIAFVVSFGVVTALAVAPIDFEPVERTEASNCIDEACSNHHGKPTPCPEGSYSIGTEKNGEHICKLEPTGCPYGDSIPMDMCDKFAPKNNEGNNDSENSSTRSTESQEEQSVGSTCSK